MNRKVSAFLLFIITLVGCDNKWGYSNMSVSSSNDITSLSIKVIKERGSFFEITNISLKDIKDIYFKGIKNDDLYYEEHLNNDLYEEVYNKLNIEYELKTYNYILNSDCGVKYSELMSTSKQLFTIIYEKNNEIYEMTVSLFFDRYGKEQKTNLFFWDEYIELLDYYVSTIEVDLVLE